VCLLAPIMGPRAHIRGGPLAGGPVRRAARRALPSVVTTCLLGWGLCLWSAGAASASAGSLRFYGVGTEPQTTTPSGSVLGPDGHQRTGDYLIDTYQLYAGTEAHHSRNWHASVSLHCLITSLGDGRGITGQCEAVLARGGSMLVAFHQETFTPGADHVYSAPIIFGTGSWSGKVGEMVGHDIGLGNNREFTVDLRP
jgi:hypothetical protein